MMEQSNGSNLEKPYYNVSEAARILNMSRYFVENNLRREKPEGWKRLMIPRSEIERVLNPPDPESVPVEDLPGSAQRSLKRAAQAVSGIGKQTT